jgi:hypothetical protein
MSMEMEHDLSVMAPGPRLIDCDQIAILGNPGSTRAIEVRAEVESLQKIPRLDLGRKEYVFISTERDPELTTEKIADHFDKSDGKLRGLVLAGGDSTQSVGLDAALRLGIVTPVGLYRGGNANNLPYMASRRRDAASIGALIKYGVASSIRPANVGHTKPGESEAWHRAFAHFSVGLVGRVSHGANQVVHRQVVDKVSAPHRLIEEGIMAGRSVVDQPPLLIEDSASARAILDLTVALGNKVGKGIRIGGMVLTEPRAAVLETAYPRHEVAVTKLARVGYTIAKGYLHHYAVLELGESLNFKVSTQLEDNFDVHYDGEADKYPSGTSFSIALHEQTVPIQTTRPRLSRHNKQLD